MSSTTTPTAWPGFRGKSIHQDLHDDNTIVTGGDDSPARSGSSGSSTSTTPIVHPRRGPRESPRRTRRSGADDPRDRIAAVVAGYEQIRELSDDERALVEPLALLRLCTNWSVWSVRAAEAVDPEYALHRSQYTWAAVDALLDRRERAADDPSNRQSIFPIGSRFSDWKRSSFLPYAQYPEIEICSRESSCSLSSPRTCLIDSRSPCAKTWTRPSSQGRERMVVASRSVAAPPADPTAQTISTPSGAARSSRSSSSSTTRNA